MSNYSFTLYGQPYIDSLHVNSKKNQFVLVTVGNKIYIVYKEILFKLKHKNTAHQIISFNQ